MKPKEFWISPEPMLNWEKFDFRGDFHVGCTVQRSPDCIHVIEKSAFDDLKKYAEVLLSIAQHHAIGRVHEFSPYQQEKMKEAQDFLLHGEGNNR